MNAVRLLSFALVALVLFAADTRAQDYPKPGPEQERLKQLVGTWDAVIKCSMEPGKAPQESKGMSKSSMGLGGFFLISEFKGEMFGHTFEGRSITGYDPYKKKYTGVWVDSMSPSLYATEGSFDKSGKVFTEIMEGAGPDGKPMKMRCTTTVKDANHMHFQLYAPGQDGKEALMMEIAYTRKK
jgi:hypothetical protein